MTMTHCLIVHSSPVAGREAEYNAWYNEQHIPDVLRVPGFVAAQRFKLPEEADKPPRYVALYEMQTDDPDALTAELGRLAGTPEMVMSDAMDMGNLTMTVATAVTGRLTA